MEEKKKERVYIVEIAYISLVGDLSDLETVVYESLLDFWKENLLILGIKSLLFYQGLILSYQGLIFLGNKRFGNWEIC